MDEERSCSKMVGGWHSNRDLVLEWPKRVITILRKTIGKFDLFLSQVLIQKESLKLRKGILFSAVGQISHDISTCLKRHISTKCQVPKVDFI